MKTLLLLRHAKSSWKDLEMADFDRPLNQRGRKAAEAMGKYIAKQQIEFDLVISSPAVRARQTIELVLKAAKVSPALRFDQRIYEASPMRLLEVVSEVEDESKAVLLVGHNPGIEELASTLSGQEGHMSTASLVRIRFNAKKWEKLAEKNGELDLFVKARDLE
jgi:phosphohistidine phosphatase